MSEKVFLMLKVLKLKWHIVNYKCLHDHKSLLINKWFASWCCSALWGMYFFRSLQTDSNLSLKGFNASRVELHWKIFFNRPHITHPLLKSFVVIVLKSFFLKIMVWQNWQWRFKGFAPPHQPPNPFCLCSCVLLSVRSWSSLRHMENLQHRTLGRIPQISLQTDPSPGGYGLSINQQR